MKRLISALAGVFAVSIAMPSAAKVVQVLGKRDFHIDYWEDGYVTIGLWYGTLKFPEINGSAYFKIDFGGLELTDATFYAYPDYVGYYSNGIDHNGGELWTCGLGECFSWVAAYTVSGFVRAPGSYPAVSDTCDLEHNDIRNATHPPCLRQTEVAFSALLLGGKLSSGELTARLIMSDAPLPEPATWTLLISGFGLAGSALRRKRWSAQVAERYQP